VSTDLTRAPRIDWNRIRGGDASGALGSVAVEVGSGVYMEGNRINDPALGQPPLCTFDTTTEWCGGVRLGADAFLTNNVIFGADAPLSFGVSVVQKIQAVGNATLLSNLIDGGGRPVITEGVSAAVHLRNLCATGCNNQYTGHFRSNILRHGTSAMRVGVLEDRGPEGSLDLQLHPENLDNNDFVPPIGGPGNTWLYRYWTGVAFLATSSADQTNNGNFGLPAWYSQNIAADPLLDSTYHLSSGSPCIDTGHPTEVAEGDFDRELRPNPDTSLPDIGPDERYSTTN
jgi:hypothetical protein